MRRLLPLLLPIPALLVALPARADGLAPVGPITQGQCKDPGNAALHVPCILQGQTWTRVMRSTDPADGLTVSGLLLSQHLSRIAKRTGLSPQDFGAACDGTTDDTVPLQQWLAAGETTALTLTASSCVFKTPLVANYTMPNIKGLGRNRSVLVYVGANNTADLITFGDGVKTLTGLDLRGFRVRSAVPMSGGAAVRIRRFQNGGNAVADIGIGNGIANDRNLKHGIWFDNINVMTLKGFDIGASGDAIRVNGRDTVPADSPNIDEGSDLNIDDGIITRADTGIHVGGGFGGLYTGAVILLGNNTHVRVDNALANRLNRELVFSAQTVFDVSKDYGLYVNDPLTGGAVINFDAFIGSAGLYGSGGVGENIHIEKWPGSFISIGSARISNATSHGIAVNDNTTSITISDRTSIAYNGGYGIFSGVQTQGISGSPNFAANSQGDRGPLVQNPARPSYTPTITPQQGTFGSVTLNSATYKRNFGGCQVDVDFTINTAGSALYGIYVTLPFTVRGTGFFIGKTLSGPAKKILTAQQNGNSLYLLADDNSSLIADGSRVSVTGNVECL